jgi:hypothetical protein
MAPQTIIIGKVEGICASTSPHDLGKIVWPIVKEVMAGASEKAMRDLETAAEVRKVFSGMDAVGQLADFGARAVLFVEEDYHVKGGIDKRVNFQRIALMLD